jgi:hypothetical protein
MADVDRLSGGADFFDQFWQSILDVKADVFLYEHVPHSSTLSSSRSTKRPMMRNSCFPSSGEVLACGLGSEHEVECCGRGGGGEPTRYLPSGGPKARDVHSVGRHDVGEYWPISPPHDSSLKLALRPSHGRANKTAQPPSLFGEFLWASCPWAAQQRVL